MSTPCDQFQSDMRRCEHLADKFIEQLKLCMTDAQLRQVVQMNAAEVRPGVCHLHDFCDANEVMLKAFAAAEGRECDTQDDDDAKLLTDAWAQALARGFDTEDKP